MLGVASGESLKRTSASLRRASPKSMPRIMVVDEEGGSTGPIPQGHGVMEDTVSVLVITANGCLSLRYARMDITLALTSVFIVVVSSQLTEYGHFFCSRRVETSIRSICRTSVRMATDIPTT